MKSIRTKIILITVIAIALSMAISTFLGIREAIEIGQSSAEQAMQLLCENGEKNLNFYFDGVEGTEIDHVVMASLVDNLKLYDHGYAFLTDDQGNLIYHPYLDVQDLSGKELPRTPQELNTAEAVVHYVFNGTEKVAVRRTLENGMILNVSVPTAEINGNLRSVIARTVLASVVILTVILLLALKFAKFVIKPLTELTDAARKVSDGEYNVEFKYDGNDEVGVLTAAFRSLIEHMKLYVRNLSTINQHLKEDNVALEAATIRDSLTGVKNRFALRRDYDSYHEKEMHVMMLDVDDVKSGNEKLSHAAGDYVLKKTGDVLKEIFGAEHSYRYGGDEFLILLPEASGERFKALLEIMRSKLEKITLDGKKLPIRFSAGYVYGNSMLKDDLRLMLRSADELLYKAKGQGMNSFVGEAYHRETALLIKKREEEAFRQG